MRKPVRKRKKLDYPEETKGSRIAAQIRKQASKLTAEEEAEFFRKAMVRIYGGQHKETTGTREIALCRTSGAGYIGSYLLETVHLLSNMERKKVA